MTLWCCYLSVLQRLQDGSEVTQFLMKLYIKQQPTAEALMPILHLALPHCSPNKPSHGELPLTDILLSPGAYHLPASTIQDLVRVCLRLSDWAHGPLILGLPAAHLLSPYAVACLLDFAISMSVSTNHNRPYHYPSQHGLIFKALCKLPGAANMSAVQLTKFLMRVGSGLKDCCDAYDDSGLEYCQMSWCSAAAVA